MSGPSNYGVGTDQMKRLSFNSRLSYGSGFSMSTVDLSSSPVLQLDPHEFAFPVQRMSHTPPSSDSPPFDQSSLSSSTSTAKRKDLHDMSTEKLKLECQRLRDENHQLQLRVLGVNELARLLQDRSELVQVLEERNKRLVIALVRLESRLANDDRRLESVEVRAHADIV